MNWPSLSFILIAIFMPWFHLRFEWKGRSNAKQTKSTKWEVISVPSLEQLRKKDCPNSWSARLSQSQDVDGQGLGYTSRHSGCNTTIQQFLCCILRRALTSLVLSYKPPPLAFNKDILHWPVCSQSSLATGPLVKFWMTIPKFWPKPILRLLFRYQIFQNRKPQKIGKSFETEMSISVVKFSASGCGVGWGREPSIATQIKTAATQTYVSTLNPLGAAFWARRELWRGAWSVLFQLDKNVICHWKWEPGQAMSDHDWWRQNSAIIKSWSRVRPIKNKPTAAQSSGQNLRLWPLADFTIQV